MLLYHLPCSSIVSVCEVLTGGQSSQCWQLKGGISSWVIVLLVSLGRCEVLLRKETNISIKFSFHRNISSVKSAFRRCIDSGPADLVPQTIPAYKDFMLKMKLLGCKVSRLLSKIIHSCCTDFILTIVPVKPIICSARKPSHGCSHPWSWCTYFFPATFCPFKQFCMHLSRGCQQVSSWQLSSQQSSLWL